jgi:tetratricopeptide (TPR) repeat protein
MRNNHSTHAPRVGRIHLRPLIWFVMLLALAGCRQEPRLSTNSQEAVRHYQAGVKERNRFYFNEAKAEFLQALKADSGFAMGWLGLATVGYFRGSESDARRNIVKALSLTGRVTPREGFAIRMWDHRIGYRLDEARAAAESLVQRYPDEACAYQFLGELAGLTKNQELAAKWFTKAIELDTSFALAVMSRGYAYSNMGQSDRAIAEMERYIRLEPDAADPRASLADLLVRAGRYQEALGQYQKSLELKPDYWYAFKSIGSVYALLGRLREAEQQIRTSLELLPPTSNKEASLLLIRGEMEGLRNNYAETARMAREALTIDSSLGEAAFQLAHALARTGKFKDADRTIERLREELERRGLRGSVAMGRFHLLRARVLGLEGKYAEAVDACNESLESTAFIDRFEVFRILADIRRRMGDTERALDACSEALSINNNNPFALLTLVRIYHQRNDAQMTREIAGRLQLLWSKADPDFYPLLELRAILSGRSPA